MTSATPERRSGLAAHASAIAARPFHVVAGCLAAGLATSTASPAVTFVVAAAVGAAVLMT